MVEVRVASVRDVPDGNGIVVDIAGKRLAVFRSSGEFFTLDETCPHRGGPLHEGVVQKGVVACPWHMWQFDLRNGCSPINPLSKVRTYRTWIEGDDVFVELGETG
jgi:3-phenylpropionate/trans-cinnamate dioxygenase ferredoxin component